MQILTQWWPVTHDFGIVRSDVDKIAAVRASMYRDAGIEVAATMLSGPLEHCLSMLEPLSPAPTKELFLSTTFGWTVYFANGTRGSDPDLPMMQLSRALGVTALRACVTPPSVRYLAVILAVYDTSQAGSDEHGYRRSIVAANDGGRWLFEQTGVPFPFEDTERYDAPRKRDRFTPDMLFSYLESLGIPRLFDEMLQPNGNCRGLLLARQAHRHLPTYSLEEAKAL